MVWCYTYVSAIETVQTACYCNMAALYCDHHRQVTHVRKGWFSKYVRLLAILPMYVEHHSFVMSVPAEKPPLHNRLHLYFTTMCISLAQPKQWKGSVNQLTSSNVASSNPDLRNSATTAFRNSFSIRDAILW